LRLRFRNGSSLWCGIWLDAGTGDILSEWEGKADGKKGLPAEEPKQVMLHHQRLSHSPACNQSTA